MSQETKQVNDQLEKLSIDDSKSVESSTTGSSSTANTSMNTSVNLGNENGTKSNIESYNDIADQDQDEEDVSLSSTEDCSLYVGDLPPDATEAHLFDLFTSYGQIKSIRVAKDNLTRRSLGYAFVNFMAPDDAKKALAETEPKVLFDRTLRIMPFQRDPALRNHNSSGNIFIKNLHPSIDSIALRETFAAFGNVVSCKIAHDEFGVSRGFGYVLFEHPKDAETAIERMNGVLMNDQAVTVTHHVSKKERMNRLEEMKANYTNLYVKNIAPEVSESEFREMFEKHGQVASMSLPLDNEGKSRGFGFVNFSSHEQAVAAAEALNGIEFHEKRLYVSRAQKKFERLEELRQQQEVQRIERLTKYQGTNLYIKYLDVSIGDDELKEAFKPFGNITSAKIMTDDNGQSRGFGFVCYATPEEAQRAIGEMHQTELKGNQIYVNLAQRKERGATGGSMLGATTGGIIGGGGLMGPGPAGRVNGPGGVMFNGMSPQIPYGFVTSPQFNNGKFPAVAPQPVNPAFIRQPMRPGQYPIPMMQQGPNSQAAPPPPPGPLYYPIQSFVPPQAMGAGAAGMNKKFMNGNGPSDQNRWGAGPPQFNNTNNHNNKGRRGGGMKNNQRSKNNQQEPFGSTLSAAVASASTPEAAKQVIGEALYPKVSNHPSIKSNQELAGKITGMLLDQETDALLRWIDDEVTLRRHIQQAYDAYMEYLSKA